MMDHYTVLGVRCDATDAEISSAYKKAALRWHPDRVAPDDRKVAHKKFVQISAAYECLSDPTKRSAYDAGSDMHAEIDPMEAFRCIFGSADAPAPPFAGWVALQLICAILIDLIGVASFALPLVGEFTDIIWAPISAWLIGRIFRDQMAARFGLLEELLPGFDFIPTACLAWARQYIRFVPLWINVPS